MHHQYPSKNFSLYFTHWDRALETIKPGYEDEIGRIKKEQAVRAEGGGGGGLRRDYSVLVACMGSTLALSVLAYLAAYNALVWVL